MPVVSEADLVDYCNAAHLGDDAADLLVELETYVVASIEKQLGIYLGTSASKTEYLDGGSYVVFLAQPPITLTSVSTRSGEGDTFEALDSADYLLTDQRIRKMDGVIFPDGLDTVKVVYAAGYNGADWQLPLRRLILNSVNWMARIGRKASVEEVLKEAADGELPHWNDTLRLYKRPLYG